MLAVCWRKAAAVTRLCRFWRAVPTGLAEEFDWHCGGFSLFHQDNHTYGITEKTPQGKN
jgi:hypothetical protein